MNKLVGAIISGFIGFFIVSVVYTLFYSQDRSISTETKWNKLDNLPQEYGLHYIPYKDDSNNGYLICAKDYVGISITFVAVKWN